MNKNNENLKDVINREEDKLYKVQTLQENEEFLNKNNIKNENIRKISNIIIKNGEEIIDKNLKIAFQNKRILSLENNLSECLDKLENPGENNTNYSQNLNNYKNEFQKKNTEIYNLEEKNRLLEIKNNLLEKKNNEILNDFNLLRDNFNREKNKKSNGFNNLEEKYKVLEKINNDLNKKLSIMNNNEKEEFNKIYESKIHEIEKSFHVLEKENYELKDKIKEFEENKKLYKEKIFELKNKIIQNENSQNVNFIYLKIIIFFNNKGRRK